MICGVGVDIVDIGKFARSIDKYGDKYLEKMFTAHELEYCRSVANPLERYAARMAAKEAAMKALGTGWNQDVDWLDFEVTNEPLGQPILSLYGKAAEMAKSKGICNIWISMSHVRDYAMAQVVFEC